MVKLEIAKQRRALRRFRQISGLACFGLSVMVSDSPTVAQTKVAFVPYSRLSHKGAYCIVCADPNRSHTDRSGPDCLQRHTHTATHESGDANESSERRGDKRLSRTISHPISSHTTLLYAEHAHHLQPPPHSYACVHAPQTRTAHGTPLARPSTPRLARCDTHDGREAHTRLCHPLLANMAPRSTSHCFGCASAHAEQVHVPGNAACEAPPASGRLRRRSDTSLGFHCGHAPAALPHLPSA